MNKGNMHLVCLVILLFKTSGYLEKPQFIIIFSSYVSDFCMWGRVPLVVGPMSYFQLTAPLHELDRSRYSFNVIDNRHGGLNLSFFKAYLEYSSLLTILLYIGIFAYLMF